MTDASLVDVLLICLAACHPAAQSSGGAAGRTAGPHLAVVDSLVLTEADSIPLGRFTSFFARDHEGRVYVSDLARRQVQQFAADGRFERIIGRPGSGPGEFNAPAALAVIRHDSILVVTDGVLRRLLYFHLPDGKYLGAVDLPTQSTGTEWTERGDTIVFASQEAPRPLIARWIWGTDTVTDLAPLPPYELAHLGAFIGHGRPDVVPTDSGYVLTLPTRNGVVVADRLGQITRSVEVPALRRRGISPAIMAREHAAALERKVLLAGSATDGLHRLPSGEWVLVHADADFIGEPPQGRWGNNRLWVSILSPDLRRACVDARVPLASDVPQVPAFRGDTLFVLSRTVTDSADVRDVLYGVGISDAGCDWIPTTPGVM